MRTVSIFSNGRNQAVRLPRDMEYSTVNELEITKKGDTITLRPVRPDWLSFADIAKIERADDDFLINRKDIIADEGRFDFA